MSALQNHPRITPFLWFDSNAEEAVDFYLSVFKNSRRLDVLRNPAGGPGPEGKALTIAFELEGQKFTALNGGPHFKFNEAVSFVVTCNTQEELDYYWTKLTDGGSEVQCGWLKDKFGLSWQNRGTGQSSQGDAGHDENDQAGYSGAGARRAIVIRETSRTTSQRRSSLPESTWSWRSESR
jgi:predicted 3-demethylubiquinone-9 3-methyltransferase (glyoxalase superfamily)